MSTISDFYPWDRGRSLYWGPWPYIDADFDAEVRSRGTGSGGDLYFIYIDDAHELTASREDGFDGPYGEATTRPDGISARIRTSAVSVRQALELMRNVTPLGVEVSHAERERRRAELRQYLSEVPIPPIDLLLTREQAEEPWARLVAPGAWHMLGVSDNFDEPDSVLVLVGDNEDGQEAGSRRAWAEFLLLPLPQHELRLRDIFSLKHIPDAELDDDSGGLTPDPVPEEPLRGPLGSGVVRESSRYGADGFPAKLTPEVSS